MTTLKKIISIQVLISLLVIAGYCMNISKLVSCDFEPSYKSEILRGVGVMIPPVGVVMGFLELKDIKK